MSFPIPVRLKAVQLNQPIRMTVKDLNEPARMGVQTPIVTSSVEDYTGPYAVTPGDSRQVLRTNNRRTTQDIVVEPIPQNYGKITYNGSVITVS